VTAALFNGQRTFAVACIGSGKPSHAIGLIARRLSHDTRNPGIASAVLRAGVVFVTGRWCGPVDSHRDGGGLLHDRLLRAQLKKCWDTGSAGDLSLRMLLILATGVALWIGYGVLKGDIVIILANAVPIDSDAGQRGFLKIGQDVTARRRAERALRQMGERVARFAEASSDVVWIRNAATLRFEFASPSFETTYGLDRRQVFAGNSLRRWLRLVHPEDRASALGSIRAVREGRRTTHEFRVRRRDGTVRWIKDTDFPVLDDAGRVVAVGRIGADITDEKRASDRLRVLVREVQHRTRNLFAVVMALADSTGRESGSIGDFRERFAARMSALSRVQGMLSQLAEDERVTFDGLLNAELAAHGMLDDPRRVTLAGPSGVSLKSRNVQTFALALHELATNAVKYGAFAAPGGHLAVHWRVETTDGSMRLHVDWRETGLHGLDRHARSRVGRQLIERALPFQMDAQTMYSIEEQGVHCVIVLSLGR